MLEIWKFGCRLLYRRELWTLKSAGARCEVLKFRRCQAPMALVLTQALPANPWAGWIVEFKLCIRLGYLKGIEVKSYIVPKYLLKDRWVLLKQKQRQKNCNCLENNYKSGTIIQGQYYLTIKLNYFAQLFKMFALQLPKSNMYNLIQICYLPT